MEDLVTSEPRCRGCGAPLKHSVVDLGDQPLANSYLTAEQLGEVETKVPLEVFVCGDCWFVQHTADLSSEEIFSDYAYFSSYSDSWLEHCRDYVAMAVDRFGLGEGSLVAEVASNDGYLLQYFVERGIPVLGIEPAANVANVANERGVPTIARFFGESLGRELATQNRRADLAISNNVLAHTPRLNDFVAGFTSILAEHGVWTIEAPHLLNLLRHAQFDTIYHEHFSYLSFGAVRRLLQRHDLEPFDVEKLSTHGGSLRIFVKREGDPSHSVRDSVARLLAEEEEAGLFNEKTYAEFGAAVRAIRTDLLAFLRDAKAKGKSVVGYGAPAKGNTLLNYCGIGPELLAFTVDRSPHKQELFLPGSHIPIHAPEKIFEERPDIVLILPWNLAGEITEQMAGVREWGGRFAIAIPEVRLL